MKLLFYELKMNMLLNFIKTLVINMSERVLITREDNFVKDFSE